MGKWAEVRMDKDSEMYPWGQNSLGMGFSYIHVPISGEL